jgi:iron complex transport system substrate-binding protein
LDRRSVLAGLAGLAVAGVGGFALTRLGPSGAPTATGGVPGRIVSLSPQLTETVFALGAASRLVGRSPYCTLPPEAVALASVGTALTPEVEAIVRLRPDLVLAEATTSIALDGLASVLQVERLPWLTAAEAAGSIRTLGARLGVAAGGLAARFAALDLPPAAGPRALVLLGVDEVAKGRAWFVKDGTLHGAALAAAGLSNAVPGPVPGPPELSVERLVAADPDLILVLEASPKVDAEGEPVAAQALAALAPVLRAVRERRVAVLSGPEVLSSGPSILALPQRLAGTARALGVP